MQLKHQAKKLGVVMNPIASINYKKDSTLAMLWEAQSRGYAIYYFELGDLFLKHNQVWGDAHLLTVDHNPNKWFTLQDKETIAINELNVILMRQDPPVNDQYIYTTYLLDQAQREGVLVVNRPQSLRDANEKLFATLFPQCLPPTIVTQSKKNLREFWIEHEDIVCKPLNSMGGSSVFRLTKNDVNANVVFEILSQNETAYLMAQRFIPEITQGDKRILMINGKPVPQALVRIPAVNDWRGNLAAGATGVTQPLTARDYEICEQVGAELSARGLMFVGLDVIGPYLTEINVTSPTGIREIDHGCGMNVSALLFDEIEKSIP